MRASLDDHDFDALAPVLADYLLRLDRGEAICREAFLAEHPEHSSALREYFSDSDLIDQFAGSESTASYHDVEAMPREFGEYLLLDEIGRGGMGIVYRARERSTGRIVALKMLLHSVLLSKSELQRFRNEARTAANLDHAGIMPIYHVGEHRGYLFYTMLLLPGGNLAQRLAGDALEPRACAELLLVIAQAVAAAHSRRVVHRDLKPANILLDEQNQPVVADFGLARWLGEETLGLTMTGDLLGTPNYMAPEQVNGRPALVGPSADIYAMGAVLYALLVGHAPFQSESVSETLRKICDADPPRPRQIRRDIPRDLETICLKCLEKSPTNRYGSANELADDLRRFLDGKPLVAQRVSPIEHGRRWFVRNPIVGSLAVGIALALLAGAGLSLFYAQQSREREQQALANLYAADMNLAQQHLRSGAVASALRLLERHQPTLPLPGSAASGHHNSPPLGGEGLGEGGPWEWRHLWHQCHGELRRFEGPQGAVYAAAFSPDGRTVAAAGADHLVWIWETATGNVVHKLAGHTATVRDLAFFPDGKQLASVGDDGVCLVWNTATGQQVATLNPPPSTLNNSLTTVATSPDGRFLATGGNDNPKVNLWDTDTNTLLHSLDLGPAESLAFQPGDSRLAIAGRDGCIRACRGDEVGSWTLDRTIPAHSHIIRDVAWSPDGTQIATAGADRSVKLWDATSWSELDSITAFKESVYAISFRPDGKRLAMAARNEPVKVWDFDEGRVVSELLGHVALTTSIAFCPDGWRLVSASEDGTVRLWDPSKPSDHDRLDGHQGQVRTVAFSPDGRILASGGEDSSITLWNAKTSQPVRVLRSHAGQINDLTFSPDGNHIAAAEHNGHLRIWRVVDGSETLDKPLNSGPLLGVSWEVTGNRVAVHALDGAIRILDANSGREWATWSSPRGPHGSVAFNNDGRLLLTASGDDAIRIWHTVTRKLVHEIRGHAAPVVTAVFSPNGSLIASASNDHTVRLWDANTGRHIHTLTGHGGTPRGLAFSPDGSRLASGSTDRIAKLWDVATGLELQSLNGHTGWVGDIAFSPAGHSIAAAGLDGAVCVWHTPQLNFRHPSREQSRENAELSTLREATALVKHLATRLSDRSTLIKEIETDTNISDAVRESAFRQAEEQLLHWPHMLDGHRAAECKDWDTAIASFELVTDIAPSDVMHWRWLAMAGLAAGRPETYHRACNELLHCSTNYANDSDTYWTVVTCLAAPHDPNELARVGKLMDANELLFSGTIKLLYELRSGRQPQGDMDFTRPPATLDPRAEDWYVLAMAWFKLGEKAKAVSAYETGASRARSGSMQHHWDQNVFRELLRREVESLLAAVPSSEDVSPRRATSGPTSTSEFPLAKQASGAAATAEPK